MASKWTAERVAEIVDQVRAGQSYRDISEQTGAGIASISRWAAAAGVEPPGSEQVQAAVTSHKLKWVQRRADLVDEMGAVAAEILQRVRDTGQAREAKDYAVTVAVLVEKAELMSGAATSRHEQLDAQRRRARVDGLADELASRRAAKDGTTGN